MEELPEDTKVKIEENQYMFGYIKYFFDFSMENWYQQLKEYTMKTTFIDLSYDEASAIFHLILEYTEREKKISYPKR